jgi:hypothetical protein
MYSCSSLLYSAVNYVYHLKVCSVFVVTNVLCDLFILKSFYRNHMFCTLLKLNYVDNPNICLLL